LKKNAVLNGKTGKVKEVKIVGRLPLTILIDGHKIVTLMTLGIYQDLPGSARAGVSAQPVPDNGQKHFIHD
jgi:hypothetical protein